jgi:selenide,water dikinase
MQASSQPVARDIVLVGGGHSHVVVLKRFGMQPEPGVRLTVICTDSHTPYSGMLPGYVAGHYRYDDVHIDLRRLAQFAGARFYRSEVTGIDRAGNKVLCKGRPPVPYDQLSINIGSTPQLAGVPGAAGHVVPVKPIHQFNQRWLALLDRARAHMQGPLRIAVVGAGSNCCWPCSGACGRSCRHWAATPICCSFTCSAREAPSCPPTTPACASVLRACWPTEA